MAIITNSIENMIELANKDIESEISACFVHLQNQIKFLLKWQGLKAESLAMIEKYLAIGNYVFMYGEVAVEFNQEELFYQQKQIIDYNDKIADMLQTIESYYNELAFYLAYQDGEGVY